MAAMAAPVPDELGRVDRLEKGVKALNMTEAGKKEMVAALLDHFGPSASASAPARRRRRRWSERRVELNPSPHCWSRRYN